MPKAIVRIEPSIKPRIDELNEFAAREIAAHRGSRSARMHYAYFLEDPDKFHLLLNEGPLLGETRRRTVIYDSRFRKVSDKYSTLEEDEELARIVGAQTGKLVSNAPNTAYQQSQRSHGKIYERLLDLARIKPSDEVLELGPGVGALTDLIAAKAGKVLAVDLSPQVIQKLRERLRAQGTNNVALAQEQYTALPQKGRWHYGQFDKVVSAFGTDPHHNPSQLFKMIKASLRPGGSLVLVEATPFHENLLDQIEKAGFEVKHCEVKPYEKARQVYGEGYYTLIYAKRK